MRSTIAATLLFTCVCATLAIGFGVGAARAADDCGPGCHSTVSGACVVNGWETGAVKWNECPAGLQPRPPCPSLYVWRRHLKTCIRAD